MNYETVIKKGISFSLLRAYNQGLECAFAYRKGLKKQTEAMKAGNALDLFLLSPDTFADEFYIADVEKWTTKKAKDLKQKIIESGKTPMKTTEFNELKETRDMVMLHPECAELLTNMNASQKKLEWEHFDLPFLGYADGISEMNNDMIKGDVIFDLKRTAKASYKEFMLQANRDILDVQAAMYQIGYEYMYGLTLPFVWLVVGSNWCGVVYLPSRAMKQARKQYYDIVGRFKNDLSECHFDNEFVPYDHRTFNRSQWRISSE